MNKQNNKNLESNHFDSYAYKSKVIKNKNSYIGRTYKISDDDLPHKNQNSGKIVNVAVIDENNRGELAINRLTTRETVNAKPFKNKHRIYKGYKTFVETKFQNNDYITAYDNRLQENPWKNNLTNENLEDIRYTCLYHSKQANENRFKIQKLKKRNKKK